MIITISVAEQRLRLIDSAGALVREYPVSTARAGTGSEPGSQRTPLGRFRIAHKIGGASEPGTIFKSREPIGRWIGGPSDDDYILSRILWLDGLESDNANTKERYIYIHGTNHEELIGSPASHGCIRMRNNDVIELYAYVAEGTPVMVLERS